MLIINVESVIAVKHWLSCVVPRGLITFTPLTTMGEGKRRRKRNLEEEEAEELRKERGETYRRTSRKKR